MAKGQERLAGATPTPTRWFGGLPVGTDKVNWSQCDQERVAWAILSAHKLPDEGIGPYRDAGGAFVGAGPRPARESGNDCGSGGDECR